MNTIPRRSGIQIWPGVIGVLLEELEETLAWLKAMHALHPKFEPMMVNRAISRSTRAVAKARGEVSP